MTIVQKKLFMRMVIILNSLMLWGVDAVGFKGEDIADIFFITEHCVNGTFTPFIFAGGGFDALSFKFFNNSQNAHAGKVHGKYILNDFCLFSVYGKFPDVGLFVSKTCSGVYFRSAIFQSFLYSPILVISAIFIFFFSKGSQCC